MSTYLTNDKELTAIANAIREKNKTSSSLTYPTDFINAIEEISVGIDTSDSTATANDILDGKTAYVNGAKITGNILTKTSSDLFSEGAAIIVPPGYYSSFASKTVQKAQLSPISIKITVEPTISLNKETGSIKVNVLSLLTNTFVFNEGYISTSDALLINTTAEGASTMLLDTQPEQIVTPGTIDQTIESGKYLTGTQTIKGDANLVASNIAKGISIFGITGTHSSGIDTSDATATASSILNGETAYAKGVKITGNIPSKSSTDLTVTGATVTAPAGYYPTSAAKTIDSGSTIQNEPVINSSTGLITATATVTTGYQEESTKSNTLQLATQEAQTITPGTSNQTIAAGKYLIGTQTIVGDANLTAANIAQGVSIFGVIGTHSGGGGDGPTDFIENHDTLTSYENLRASKIAVGTFAYCTSLTTVNFPECLDIGKDAFCNCIRLTTISFPACTTIGVSAFNDCQKLTTVSFPACVNINSYAFTYCYSLTTISFPVCTSIAGFAFSHCSSLVAVTFPKCSYIGRYAFNCCDKLITINFPVCTTIGNNTFAYCTSLTSVRLPLCTSIMNNVFYSCTKLATISLPACTTIETSAFQYCTYLVSLYLTGSKYVALSNSNAFSSTPIGGYSTSAGQYGSIYVPASMLVSYRTRTNWTYFSSRFVGI